VSRHRPSVAAALTLLVLIGCACGVPTQGSPRSLGKGDVPKLPPTSTTTSRPSANLPFTVVWLNGSNDPSPQVFYAASQADRLSNALDTLLNGPTGSQFFTAIPSSTTLHSVTPNPVDIPTAAPNEPIVVNLSDEFIESSGLDEVLAVEQVVFTIACNLTPATHVSISFEVEGAPLQVPVLSGSPVSRPVTPADYDFTPGDCTAA
jgi:spore germination protein GerM